jgi:hypothetical protein
VSPCLEPNEISSETSEGADGENEADPEFAMAYPILCTRWIVSVAQLLVYLIGPVFLYQA